MAVIDLIKQIPAEFWGILIGALLALAGVVLSNRANLRNLREQLLHDREVRAKEREHALRKEVYLEVAEAIKIGTECLAKHGNLDLTYEELVSPYAAKSGSIAKSYVIGGDEVVSSLVTLAGKISTAMLRLAAKRAELLEVKKRIAGIQAKIQRADTEGDRYFELMRQQNIDGNADQRLWDALNENFEFEQTQFKEFTTELDALVANARPRHFEFMRECAREAHALWEFIVPAIFAVRRELEMPIDEAGVRELFAKNVAESEAAIEAFTQRLQGDEGDRGNPA